MSQDRFAGAPAGLATPSSSGPVVKPVLGLPAIIRQLTTSWGGGETDARSWAGLDAITYAMPDAAPTNGPAGPPEAAGIVALTAHQTAQAELAFALWDDLIPQSLIETRSPGADIVVEASSQTRDGGTYTTPTVVAGSAGHDRIQAAQVWLSSTWATNQDASLTPESYGALTYVHEIGHSLGLSHPGTYDAASNRTPTYALDATYDRDNRRYSLMSYFGGYDPARHGWASDGTSATWLFPDTPMVDDIAAIQSLYGADTSTRAGNTTYGFNCTLAAGDPERAIYDFSLNPTPIFTIWDAGGTDTLDGSAATARQVIDLTPGAYSSVDGLTDNVAIAYGCSIERAIGGSGDDVLVSGGAGDTLTGGAGADLFKGSVATLRGDTITDFSATDTIDLTDLTAAGATCRYDAAANLLTVAGGAGGASCSFTLSGSLGQARFTLASDGAAGTSITLAVPVPAPTVAFDPATAGFANGRTPILTGSVAAAGGPASVEIFDGDPARGGRDLGAATVHDDGTWVFSADLGAGDFAALTAVATDALGQAATALAPYELVTAVVGQPYRAVEYDQGGDGRYGFVRYGRKGAVLRVGIGPDDGPHGLRGSADPSGASAASGEVISAPSESAVLPGLASREPFVFHAAAEQGHAAWSGPAGPCHAVAALLAPSDVALPEAWHGPDWSGEHDAMPLAAPHAASGCGMAMVPFRAHPGSFAPMA